MPATGFIQDLAILLVVAAAAGWVCQRLRISVVAGYLVAGWAVGPNMGSWALIKDLASAQTLEQAGLVVLMFSIGLRLSVRKLRRMGIGLAASVVGSAMLVFYLTRLLGASLGLDATASAFVAATLMVSSSTIISKLLQESGAAHERAGHLALGVTVLEGFVAVVMLTVLNSYVQFGANEGRVPLGATLGELSAFVVMTAVAGLLIVPWLLRRVSGSAGDELQTVAIVGLLFALAIVTQFAGYSIALGAFLLGVIVAETPHRRQVERTFESLRDVFSAVFFTVIGLQTRWVDLGDNLGLVIGLSAFVLVARVLAYTLSLTVIGIGTRDSVRVGITVLPLGEFSFIIAQLGVVAGLLPAAYFSVTVGVSLISTLIGGWLARKSPQLLEWVDEREPAWLTTWVAAYHGWVERLLGRRRRNLLWQLTKKRIVQVAVGAMCVSGLLVFSERLLEACTAWLGRDLFFPNGLSVLFWIALTLVVLVPLVAIWRNISAMALLYAQVMTQGSPQAARVRPWAETALKTLAGGAIYLWLSSLLPGGEIARWLLVVTAAVAVVALLVLRRKLILWHSELESELQEVLTGGQAKANSASSPWLRPHVDWNLSVADFVLPELAECQGRTLADLAVRSRFGCTVVGIERQGYMIALPTPDAVLYPRDKVMLLGTPSQVQAGRAFLTAISTAPVSAPAFDDVRMELIEVPPGSRAANVSLQVLSPAQTHEVQIAGIQRAGIRILTPGAEEVLRVGDEVLVLGTPDHLRDFRAWLQDRGDDVDDTSEGAIRPNDTRRVS